MNSKEFNLLIENIADNYDETKEDEYRIIEDGIYDMKVLKNKSCIKH